MLFRSCGPSIAGAQPCSPLTAPQVQRQVAAIALKADAGEQAPNLGSTSVQVLDQGHSLLLRLPALSTEQAGKVLATLEEQYGPLLASGTSVNTIGPTLGSRLLQGSLISLLVSFAGIAAYISFRYSGVFAFLALLCLAHDEIGRAHV